DGTGGYGRAGDRGPARADAHRYGDGLGPRGDLRSPGRMDALGPGPPFLVLTARGRGPGRGARRRCAPGDPSERGRGAARSAARPERSTMTVGTQLEEPPRVSGGDSENGHLAELQQDPIALMARVRAECGDVGQFTLGQR